MVTADFSAAHCPCCFLRRVVIEEYLDGPEVSLFAVADGRTAVPLLAAQDFEGARDGDRGPNTGGMGAYVPLPWAPSGLAEEVLATVIQPALDEMGRRGTPYRGLLYAGLALTAKGVKVIELDALLGDPELRLCSTAWRLRLRGCCMPPLLEQEPSCGARARLWHPGRVCPRR